MNLQKLKTLKNKEILKFYIIETSSAGYGFRKVRYNLYPNLSNPGSHSLGKKYDENDIWTQDISLDQWSKILQNDSYDFVYFQNVDIQFWNIYGSIFRGNMKDSSLWSIEHNEKEIYLIPLDNHQLF